MRVLGLDYGSKRVGVAVSDELKMIAQPLEFIPAKPFEEFIVRLKEVLSQKCVESIVIGMPRNMDGSYGPSAEAARAFAEKIQAEIKQPIRTWDERLTSVEANRALIAGNVRREKRKEKVDAMAAAILLQSFLDANEA
ncbi:MAG: Holliday junction resolvase RuvX [Verrucomicrobiales bacterium]|nr:Holliday junction resolvase RuvX [Verrucomicrobiales bacterium]